MTTAGPGRQNGADTVAQDVRVDIRDVEVHVLGVPDAQPFLFVQNEERSVPPRPREIHIVENWFEALKAKPPRT